MPLDTHPQFGSLYLSVADFKTSAAVFGVANLLPTDDDVIKALLAAASREVDAYLDLFFDGRVVTENHQWNPRTRRFLLNHGEPKTVTVCKLWLGPGNAEALTLTPMIADSAGREFTWGSLVYDRQLEQMVVGTLPFTTIPTFALSDITYPFVEIRYQVTDAPPPNVALAVGHQVAFNLQGQQADAVLPQGLQSIRTYDRSVTRAGVSDSANGGNGAGVLAPKAMQLLRDLKQKVTVC